MTDPEILRTRVLHDCVIRVDEDKNAASPRALVCASSRSVVSKRLHP